MARVRSQCGVYHIILRGVNQKEIFHDDDDCVKFLGIIARSRRKFAIRVYAWCLMSNHVHLLFREGVETISETMKRIGVSYASYYNSKYEVTGHLFQDRFGSEIVDSNSYLFRVIRYIHQNPVKAGIVDKPAEWRWSSCLDYYGGSNESPKQKLNLLDDKWILARISDDPNVARERFIEFNERGRQKDKCLDFDGIRNRKLSDEEARKEILLKLGSVKIAQVKSLPRIQRDEIFRRIKTIKGIRHYQAARILGVSASLFCKAGKFGEGSHVSMASQRKEE